MGMNTIQKWVLIAASLILAIGVFFNGLSGKYQVAFSPDRGKFLVRYNSWSGDARLTPIFAKAGSSKVNWRVAPDAPSAPPTPPAPMKSSKESISSLRETRLKAQVEQIRSLTTEASKPSSGF